MEELQPGDPRHEPPDRNSRWTLALIMVALIVAFGAGGAVYAVMNSDGGPTTPAPHPTTRSKEPAGDGASAAPDASFGTWKGSAPRA
ncbi:MULTISPECIES: hypothetical protein [unclassified Streptomyces]|uniref:hypothetical protein n=1 Tax=unclassified Streptomyces TaxID=2593676 RepID=UPI002E20DE15|nr:hypothetical protein OG217_17385 [Streptomyces sp. NBC_01023]